VTTSLYFDMTFLAQLYLFYLHLPQKTCHIIWFTLLCFRRCLTWWTSRLKLEPHTLHSPSNSFLLLGYNLDANSIIERGSYAIFFKSEAWDYTLKILVLKLCNLCLIALYLFCYNKIVSKIWEHLLSCYQF
jgi:hypothetical protein